MIVDILEYLNIEYIGDKYKECFDCLIKYSESPIHELRQASVYGIGVCAEQYSNMFEATGLDAVMASFKQTQGDAPREDYMHALDNSISALGKVLKHVEFNEEAFLFWLSKMPVKLDYQECKAMNKFLSEIIELSLIHI